ncbi:hypothetical protein ACPPVT_00655 [Angustibacter sp. McL0619]|uniref:hypothetical protein n=1 Tax=Angustibacter sp. McL0619 TaxID=3415676 RepID=UPI003CED67F4
MGISAAFLNELDEQRATAVHDLSLAQAIGDDIAASDAQARLDDLDELFSRNSSADITIDLDESLTRAC